MPEAEKDFEKWISENSELLKFVDRGILKLAFFGGRSSTSDTIKDIENNLEEIRKEINAILLDMARN